MPETLNNPELSNVSNKFPFTGTLTLDEEDWLAGITGIVEIDLPKGSLKRILDGRYPHRHANGQIVFVQGCGDSVNRLALRNNEGLIKVVSPCSSEYLGAYRVVAARYEYSRLSPDALMIAVEFYSVKSTMFDETTTYSTIVYDLSGNQLAFFDTFYTPEWTPDGRLLMASASMDGIYLTDAQLQNLSRIDEDKLNSPVNNLDIDPSGTRIAFEYSQQIWLMDLDGSDLKEVVSGTRLFRFPAWSPDGTSLAYLANSGTNRYVQAIFFSNLNTGESYTLDISGELNDLGRHPLGPLSWIE